MSTSGDTHGYAVIGAGPMGLACVRNLAQAGLPVTGLELHTDVGGLWDIENPHSTMYDSAHLISSRHMTEFAEHPMDDAGAAYPHHREVRDYLAGYADRFDLRRHYELGTRVVSARPHARGWELVTEHDGAQQTRVFEGLLVASGTLHAAAGAGAAGGVHRDRPALLAVPLALGVHRPAGARGGLRQLRRRHRGRRRAPRPQRRPQRAPRLPLPAQVRRRAAHRHARGEGCGCRGRSSSASTRP